jgi:hypothetical protein
MDKLLGNLGGNADAMKGFNPDMLASLLDKKDPTRMIRTFIGLGNAEMLEPMLKSVNWMKQGGDLLEAAIEH